MIATIAFTLFVAMDGFDETPIQPDRLKTLSHKWRNYCLPSRTGTHSCLLPEEIRPSRVCFSCETDKLFLQAEAIYETDNIEGVVEKVG